MDFSATATIGRQNLFVDPAAMKELLTSFDVAPTDDLLDSIFDNNSGYSEGLFRFLGARKMDSLDYSDFEGATQIQDMNAPLSPQLKEQYSTVLDGGALEHIFNFPVAIKNCMEMVRVGGHFLGITPANNFFGHGFYQFSPELYYRVFSSANGFCVERMIAFEDTSNTTWVRVADPQAVGERVTLLNDQPVYLLIIARRTDRKPIFDTAPQQSDYVSEWTRGPRQPEPEGPTAEVRDAKPRPKALLRQMLPERIKRSIRELLGRPQPPPPMRYHPKFFEFMDPQSGKLEN